MCTTSAAPMARLLASSTAAWAVCRSALACASSARGVELLLRGRSRLYQRFDALELQFRESCCGLCALQLCIGTVERNAIRPLVDDEKQRSLGHRFAFPKRDALQIAAHT